MDYCIATWDPKGKGVVEEPHHNTYDIEFWGPDGMITSFYLGALTATAARWLNNTTKHTPTDLSALGIGYTIYGAGEAKLAWLDEEFEETVMMAMLLKVLLH